MFTVEEARDLLTSANLFFATPKTVEIIRNDPDYDDEDLEEEIMQLQVLNLNDVFAWALSWGTKVEDDELIEVARMFRTYGFPGILYWAAKKDEIIVDKIEFEDIKRFIRFVENEERIIKEEPDWNKRAYYKAGYTLGNI